MTDIRKVAICIPCRDDVKTDFAMSLVRLVAQSVAHGVDVELHRYFTSLVDLGRCELVTRALAAAADWILFLDTDMVFPPDTLVRLLSRDKDIVTAAASVRNPSGTFTAQQFVGATLADGLMRVEYDPEKRGIEQVGLCGLAVALIRSNVFRRLEYPWFRTGYDKELHDRQIALATTPLNDQNGFISEDSWFYMKARQAGIEAWLDWQVTHQVGHIGSFTYHPSRQFLPIDHYWGPSC